MDESRAANGFALSVIQFYTHDLIRVIQTVVFVSGINTFIQTTLGTRLPAVMGNSFYFLAPTVSILMSPGLASIDDPHEVFSAEDHCLGARLQLVGSNILGCP